MFVPESGGKYGLERSAGSRCGRQLSDINQVPEKKWGFFHGIENVKTKTDPKNSANKVFELNNRTLESVYWLEEVCELSEGINDTGVK